MIDVYQYMTYKQFEGAKFIIGSAMIYHGLNYDYSDLGPAGENKKTYVRNEPDNVNDNDEK